jgi:DNA-binding IclR family transcriptional regulator
VISDETAGGRTVISRTAAILMAYLHGSSHSLTEIAAVTGLPLSTAHRLVCGLAACGILDRAENGEYHIGMPLRLIGTAGRAATDLEEQAHLVLQDLSHVLDADVRLGVLCDFDVRYIEKPAGRRPTSTFEQDRRLPVHATAMGKALLAFSPPEVVRLLLMRGLKAFTPHTVTAPERLRRTLAMARLSRLAVARWELEPGRSALAAPVLSPDGGAVAAIEVRVEDPAAELATVRPALTVAARSLSRQLSYTRAACSPPSTGRRSSNIRSLRKAGPSPRMERPWIGPAPSDPSEETTADPARTDTPSRVRRY